MSSDEERASKATYELALSGNKLAVLVNRCNVMNRHDVCEKRGGVT